MSFESGSLSRRTRGGRRLDERRSSSRRTRTYRYAQAAAGGEDPSPSWSRYEALDARDGGALVDALVDLVADDLDLAPDERPVTPAPVVLDNWEDKDEDADVVAAWAKLVEA